MLNNNTSQQTGDNSNAIQINNLEIHKTGFTPNEIIDIYNKISEPLYKEWTQNAIQEIHNRLNSFQEKIIERLLKLENAQKAFSDPAFQFLLRDTQKVAGISGEEITYDLLVDLLEKKINEINKKNDNTLYKRAVEIIESIDIDLLSIITTYKLIFSRIPLSFNYKKGIRDLANSFKQLHIDKIQLSNDIVDKLELLNLTRISSISNRTNLYGIIINNCDGYLALGIKKNSEEYLKALELLNSINFSNSILKENEFFPEYVKFSYSSIDCLTDYNKYNYSFPEKNFLCSPDISSNTLPNFINIKYFNKIDQKELKTFQEIINLFSKDTNKINIIREYLIKEMKQYDIFNYVEKIWDLINCNSHFTMLGNFIFDISYKRIMKNENQNL